MAASKRARTSSTSGSPSSETDVTTVELSGGWALSPALVQLWRSGRFTDTVVTVEGRSFVANRNVLAAGSKYFERHYDNEHMRDANHPKLLENVTAAAFELLLTFLYEGRCTFEESLLAPVLRAAHFLGVEVLERAAVGALTERLSPSNALAVWTWGEELELPELAEAAKETALRGFDEVEKIEDATLAQVQALVADDRLTTKSKEAVFSAVARFAEAKQPAEVDLLGLLRNVRFAQMSPSFLHETVSTWPMLDTKAGNRFLVDIFKQLSRSALEPSAEPFRVEAILGARQADPRADEEGDWEDLTKVAKGALKMRLKKLNYEESGDQAALIARLQVAYKEVGETEYMVRWSGYTEDLDSWVRISALRNCERLIAAFELTD